MKKLSIILFAAVLITSGCQQKQNVQQDLNVTGNTDKMTQVETINSFEECVAAGNPVMESYPRQCKHEDRTFTEIINQEGLLSSFSHSGELIDVSDGNATGIANARYFDKGVALNVSFDNLSELEDGFFYEGWLVRKEPFDFISTGETELDPNTNKIINIFSDDEQDLNGYDFYVLTLEPDDGDPAPAEHILEGTMTKL